jgi:Na+-driven multidrug efflux pump
MANGKEYNKYQSRKWRLVMLVIILATLGCFAPPIASLFFAGKLAIISGTEWVSIITLVVSAYFGANVLQKRIEGNNSITLSAGVNAEISTSDTEGAGKKKKITTSTIKPNENGEA